MAGKQMVSTYDAKLVIMTFGGVPLGGYADNTFVNIANESKAFKRKQGADGEVVRSRTNKSCHDVTITLLQSSDTNDYLSAMNQLDKATNHNMLPLSITDLSGTTLCFWPQAWVEQPDTWDFSPEDTDRAWVFHTGPIATDNRGGVKL